MIIYNNKLQKQQTYIVLHYTFQKSEYKQVYFSFSAKLRVFTFPNEQYFNLSSKFVNIS